MGYARVEKIKSSEALAGKYQAQQEADEFLRCPKCMRELPFDVSPRDYSHIEAGFSSRGFQVWCLRHEINIVNIDFQGQYVVADVGMFGKFGGRNYKPIAVEKNGAN
jgi:hypothetical protein